MRVTVKHKFKIVAKQVIRVVSVIVCSFALWACPKPPPPVQSNPDATQQPVYFNHTVKYAGETLAMIAGWYTGNSKNWEIILQHNPGLDVKRIRIGDVILIPQELVVKSDPLPEKLVKGVKKPTDIATPQTVPIIEPTITEREIPSEQPREAPFAEMPLLKQTPEELVIIPTEIPRAEPSPPPAIVVPTAETLPALKPTPESTQNAAVASTSAPSQGSSSSEKRMKSRDELLQQLLQEN
jgi:hypothetical protein